TEMPNAGSGVTPKFEKNFSGLQNCARRQKASFEAKTTVSTASLAGTRFLPGHCYSQMTNRLLNCCYPICSDTPEVCGTILLGGPRGTRITPRTSKAMPLQCLRSFKNGKPVTH